MSKERIMLAFVGIITGLIVASSAFFFFQQNQNPPIDSQTATDSATPAATNKANSLEIETPQDQSITSDKVIDVKGKYLPNATIIISTDTEDLTTTSDATGAFAQKVTLSEYDNTITITAIAENGENISRDIEVTYTTEEI